MVYVCGFKGKIYGNQYMEMAVVNTYINKREKHGGMYKRKVHAGVEGAD